MTREARASRLATREAVANGAMALVLMFFEEHFSLAALAGILVGSALLGALARGLADHVSRRYLRTKQAVLRLRDPWEWGVVVLQLGLAVVIAWQLGPAVGVVAAAVVAGAAIPGIEPVATFCRAYWARLVM